jgi:hypothetical protein
MALSQRLSNVFDLSIIFPKALRFEEKHPIIARSNIAGAIFNAEFRYHKSCLFDAVGVAFVTLFSSFSLNSIRISDARLGCDKYKTYPSH